MNDVEEDLSGAPAGANGSHHCREQCVVLRLATAVSDAADANRDGLWPRRVSRTAECTVVLNVDTGMVVPSFLGKPLRSAVEIAQQSGLEINAIGSGIARQQWPAPGSHLTSGEHITVRFGH